MLADFVLVSPFALPALVRLLTQRSRYIACITCGNPIGGFASSPLWHGLVSRVCSISFTQANKTFNCCVQSLAFVRSGPWPAPVSPPECFNIGSSYGSRHRSSSPFRGFRLGCTPSRLLTSGDSRNNVYCTVAIIFRLWRSHRSVAGASVNSYVLRALRVFAESAALLT